MILFLRNKLFDFFCCKNSELSIWIFFSNCGVTSLEKEWFRKLNDQQNLQILSEWSGNEERGFEAENSVQNAPRFDYWSQLYL